MRRSLFWKFFLALFLTTQAAVATIYLFTTSIVREQYLSDLRSQLSHLSVSLRMNIISVLERGKDETLDLLVKELGRETGMRLTVIAVDGRVLADSAGDPARMENHADRPEFIQAMRSGASEYRRLSPTLQQNMLYHAEAISSGGKVIGVLRLSVYVTMIDRIQAQVKRKIFTAAALLSLLILILSFWSSRRLTKPLSEITLAAQRQAAGDLDARARVRGGDELKKLAESFNAMVEQQRRMIDSLRASQLELRAIPSSIRDGLLVTDLEGSIRMANTSFQSISGHPAPDGRPYWEVLRDAGFAALLQESLAKTADADGEVEIGGRVYAVHATYLAAAGRMIVTFHDISEYKRLEKVKRDFVGNLSHELRTPLTAIKGFIETLEEETPAAGRQYLEIIRRHTDRLVSIVSDLLALSELEEPGFQLQLQPVDLAQAAENIARLFSSRAAARGLRLFMETAPDLPLFRGDSYRLEQMLINLVDNALKYTDKGEVRIAIQSREKEIEIRVSDTGAGIAPEHLPRIFERFYVADRARSREKGGTGLGLAIVKHIVQLHLGSIQVQSQPGSGTVFSILLPLPPSSSGG